MELKLNVMDYLLQAVALYAAQKQTEKQRLFRTEENISWHLSSFHTRKYESLAEARGGSHDHSSKSRPAQIQGQKGLDIKKTTKCNNNTKSRINLWKKKYLQ